MNSGTEDSDDIADLPQPVIEALRAAEPAPALITATVDREIAAMAAQQFAARRVRPGRLRPAWVAMAATVLVAITAFIVLDREPPGVDHRTDADVYADVDGSGRIDIADVLLTARNASAGGVSQAEIDAFAARIVSLDRDGDAT